MLRKCLCGVRGAFSKYRDLQFEMNTPIPLSPTNYLYTDRGSKKSQQYFPYEEKGSLVWLLKFQAQARFLILASPTSLPTRAFC